MNQEIQYFLDRIAQLPQIRWKKFTNFKIIFKVGSPICVTTPFVHLDSILGHLLLLDSLGEDFYVLPRKLNISPFLPQNNRLIPICRTGEIYHCSCAQFIPNNLHVDTIYKRFEDKWANSLKINKIRVGQGHYRSYMMKEPYVSCKEVVFFARGDKEYCQNLLENYLFGLGNDYRIGFGAVRKIEFEETKEDYSIIANGIAMRTIPIEMCEEWEDEAYLPYKSPYWEPRNIGLCVPPGARCKLKGDFYEQSL